MTTGLRRRACDEEGGREGGREDERNPRRARKCEREEGREEGRKGERKGGKGGRARKEKQHSFPPTDMGSPGKGGKEGGREGGREGGTYQGDAVDGPGDLLRFKLREGFGGGSHDAPQPYTSA